MLQAKRKVEDGADSSSIINTAGIKDSKLCGSIFHRTNIYSLKYLIEKYQDNPNELREKLLKYTKLSQPYCLDIQIDVDFLTEEDIKIDIGDTLDKTPSKLYSKSQMNIDIDQLNCFQDVSSEQYGQVILKMVEILGVSVEARAKSTLLDQQLSKELSKEIQILLAQKTKYFYIMLAKTIEDLEEVRQGQEYLNGKNIFKSFYDNTIEQIYSEYKQVLYNPESREKIANSIEIMLKTIDQVMSVVSLAELRLDEEDRNQSNQQCILSYKEQSNLIKLRELISTCAEYFAETLKPLTDRQFFYWREIVKVNETNPDKLSTFPMFPQSYFNERYTDIIKNTLCSFANSQGGVVFLGIHNVKNKVKSITLKEIISLNIIGELKKLALSIHPKIDFEIKLINVVNAFKFNYKDCQKNDFIISINVKSRKPQEIFYVVRNTYDKIAMIKNKGCNQKLKSIEAKQLSDMRMKETDTPNLLDYLEFNQSFNPKENTNYNVIQMHYSVPSSSINKININSPINSINRQNDDQSEQSWNTTNDFKRLSRNDKNMLMQLQPFDSLLEKKSIRQISDSNSRFKYENQKSNNFQQRRFSTDQSNFSNSNGQRGSFIQDKSMYNKPTNKMNFTHQKDQFFYSPQICQLDNWKKQILKEYLNQENNVTFYDFLKSNFIQKIIPTFDSLNSKNTYLVYKIDGQYRIIFKEAVTKIFNDNQIPLEYVCNIHNFTVLKVDRERYNFKIDRLITPISINYSFQNKVIQGFNFENFEIRNVNKVPEAINILEQVYKLIGLDFEIKYIQGRLLVCFTKIQNFIFGYSTYLKIKQILDIDQYSKKVHSIFNQVTKI